jgi:hypothetical protein
MLTDRERLSRGKVGEARRPAPFIPKSPNPKFQAPKENTSAMVSFLEFLWRLFACGRIRPEAEMLELGVFG